LLHALHDHENIDHENIGLEPSALAGMAGPVRLIQSLAGRQYLSDHQLLDKLKNATHIVWATGGSMVPKGIRESYYQRGRIFLGLAKMKGYKNGAGFNTPHV
jgi:D-serine dehydratase